MKIPSKLIIQFLNIFFHLIDRSITNSLVLNQWFHIDIKNIWICVKAQIFHILGLSFQDSVNLIIATVYLRIAIVLNFLKYYRFIVFKLVENFKVLLFLWIFEILSFIIVLWIFEILSFIVIYRIFEILSFIVIYGIFEILSLIFN